MKSCKNRLCKSANPQSLTEFAKDSAFLDGLHHWCRTCSSARKAVAYRRNADKGLCRCGQERVTGKLSCTRCLNHSRRGRENSKLEVVLAYGGECQCVGCDESRQEFLSIDHVQGGGAHHRKSIGGHLYLWLKKQGFPKDNFRLLCMNCNFALGHFGYCPHEREAKAGNL